MMRLAVVGNPENRRVTLFTAAVRRFGLPAPEVFPWLDVLTAGRVPGPGTVVRVDSPGENAEVDRLLRGASGPAEHGEIVGAAAAFRGLGRALARIRDGGGHQLQDTGDILLMTDKPRCHGFLREAGIPVPEALGPIGGYEALRASGWKRVFVKPAYGSSASGVMAVAFAGRRVTAVTSAELSGGRIYNNLRVRRYDDETSIRAVVDRLAVDGLHVERWYPKASLGDRVLDLRVVVIAGEPRHVVVRTSRTPMTNLHLGNARGDVAAVREAAGEKTWRAAMGTCASVAALFPRSLHIGVDLMFRVGWRDHAVAEVNAFGDLLPGVLVDGRDTYGAQVGAIVGGRAGVPCAI